MELALRKYKNEAIDNPFLSLMHYAACIVLSPFGYHDSSAPSERARRQAEEEGARKCPDKVEPARLKSYGE
jgi:hypothetical protein